MATADLAVLRTAKQALDEGLLNPEDYDFIKKAFLRAQQIKAGLDAGFIKEEDFVQARDSFLHSLDFALVGNTSSSPTPPAQQGPAFVAPAIRPGSPRAAAAPPPVNARAPPQQPQQAARNSLTQPSAAPPAPPAPVPRLSGATGGGTVPIPTDLPPSSARGSRSTSIATNKAGVEEARGA
ncbi:hypothetical protein TSOC_007706 [Tetrabaena socialis]|uniref:Uncharacterized protein n=1 Tax=Tetrabaena socialis TaxID=47790 RepID=A0A2J8A0G0_9CHLO|nr:hypothetical protein TSOC_007706 [Tetrabaena socialis]|eukprot:PNH05968.1 hypothetical protein TSOC_007706 [Tetrabaena socialis]